MSRRNTTTLGALGMQLARERKSRGLTLEELSRKTSISKGNLSEIERGKRDPRFSTLLAIADGLGTDVSELLFVDPKRKDLYTVSGKASNGRIQQGSQRRQKRS